MTNRTLDDSIVRLLLAVESSLLRNERAPEIAEYRRGFQEALTELKNSEEMSGVLDALREVGWQPPVRYWLPPDKKVKNESA